MSVHMDRSLPNWHINRCPRGRDGVHAPPKTGPNSGQAGVNHWYITFYMDRTPPQIVDLKLQNADSTLQIVDSELQNMDSELQNVDSELQNVDSKLQNVDSEFQNVDLKLQNVDSKLQYIDSKLQTLDLKLQNRAKMAENGRHQASATAERTSPQHTTNPKRRVALWLDSLAERPTSPHWQAT